MYTVNRQVAVAVHDLAASTRYVYKLHSRPTNTVYILSSVTTVMSHCQGRSDGGIWVYIPPKSVQVDFLWGKNDVKMTVEHEYARLLSFIPSGGATLWQSSANALPVCCNALPVALPVF